MKKQLTLCLVTKEDKILLGMKKRGFGVGRWNGFGGKLNEGETLIQAAKRELEEECSIVTDAVKEVGVIDFEFQGDPKILEVHVFHITEFDGEPVETEEMRPQWFATTEIPYDMMWPDDIHWIPTFLKGAKFCAKFVMDKPSNAEYTSKLLSKDVREVEVI